MRVLFVCLGNICRSPTAEAVMRFKLEQLKLDWVEVDSAGTGDWHIGRAPDQRAQAAGKARGYSLGSLRARQVVPDDFMTFQHVLAMDHSNLHDLLSLSGTGAPGASGVAAQPRLFLQGVPEMDVLDVPDPYQGGEADFERVIDLIERGVDHLIASIVRDA